MRNRLISFWALGVFCTTLWGAPDALNLLKSAEMIRNPQVDYEMDVKLFDLKNGKTDERLYKTSVKGRTKAIVKFIAPDVDRGTKLLMVEDQMWVHMPASAKPIRISPKQKLAGNAMYGDVTRLDFVGNYDPKFVRADQFLGKKANVLSLTAIPGKAVTYDKVEYWIEQGSSRPLMAYYMTEAGKILREATFESFSPVLGVQRPTEFKIKDYIEKNHVTTLKFSNAKKADLPDILFEKQNFSRD